MNSFEGSFSLLEEVLFQHVSAWEPRQLFFLRRVCKRWAWLLSQDRFWWRHYAALQSKWPVVAQLLAGPTLLQIYPRPCYLYERYAALAREVDEFLLVPLSKSAFSLHKGLNPRAQAVWESILYAMLGSECVSQFHHGASGESYFTDLRVNSMATDLRILVVWHPFNGWQQRLRKATCCKRRTAWPRILTRSPRGEWVVHDVRRFTTRLLRLIFEPKKFAKQQKSESLVSSLIF